MVKKKDKKSFRQGRPSPKRIKPDNELGIRLKPGKALLYLDKA